MADGEKGCCEADGSRRPNRLRLDFDSSRIALQLTEDINERKAGGKDGEKEIATCVKSRAGASAEKVSDIKERHEKNDPGSGRKRRAAIACNGTQWGA